MARVTVEDCLHNVDNRFQLVLVAAKRARQLTMGKEPMVGWENDKATVVALREISAGLVDRTILEKEVEEKKEETLEDLLAAADGASVEPLAGAESLVVVGEGSSAVQPLAAQEPSADGVSTSEPININNEVLDTGIASPIPELSVSNSSSDQLSPETSTTDQNILPTPEVDPDKGSDGTPNV